MARDSSRYVSMATDIISVLLALGSSYYLLRYALNRLDLETDDVKRRKAVADAVLQKISQREKEKLIQENEIYGDDNNHARDLSRRPRKEELVLNPYEQIIAGEVIAPESISVGFEDIGGLENIVEELREAVIYPLTMPHLYAGASSLLKPPCGALLYGPPGCGKTMLAKALAKESGANFLNVQLSTLTVKWFGDSTKLVNAVFSLARKLAPTIVFIDEIDGLLSQRTNSDNDANSHIKSEFLTLWDGINSSTVNGDQGLLILGATNRVSDIDDAILRRLPKKFAIGLPKMYQRQKILQILLKDTKIDQSSFDLDFLSNITDGMSGSDLKEACRDAAMVPVREYLRQKRANGGRMGPINPDEIRGLTTDDFFKTAGGSMIRDTESRSEKLGQRRKSRVEEMTEEEFRDTLE